MRKFHVSAWVLLCLFLTMLVPGPVWAEDEDGYLVASPDLVLPTLEPKLSADGLAVANAVPPLVMVADPNPQMQGQRSLGRTAEDALAAPEAAVSTFSITYVAAGQQDPWGQVCATFPESAKVAFQAAAAIWQNKVRSSVPITVRACWANLGSSSILGYSGGQPSLRNFNGAPKANVWYQQSLANALAGVRLGTNPDMHITYNSGFPWYYGTDGNTPYGKYDLVTVAAHEIAHGLNFSGSAQYSGGTGAYGYGTGYPSVYDTFMQSGTGTPLTSYTNPSTTLGSLLTSGALWFSGPNANAANGGSRVKIYAPSTWSGGSSFSHLDYASYTGTVNRMMIYSVASASSTHDPGPVTLGIMKDLGWSTDQGFSMSGVVRTVSATGAPLAGATVAIAGKSATTSSTGSFSITGLSAGSYTLTISKAGYASKSVAGYVVNSNQSALNFFLAPAYSMSGMVRAGSTTGTPLIGATLNIAGKTVTSNSLGAFSITGLAAGSYTLTISAPGFITKTVTGYALTGNQSGLNFFLLPVPVYSMSGIVRSGSATGPALAGATVAIGGRSATSISTGAFTITAIPTGTYPLTISKAGYYSKTMAGVVVNSNSTGVVLYITPLPVYYLSGTVRHGSTAGPVLPGATLTIAGKTAVTSSAGTFSITGIPAGTQTLVISKPGYITRSITGNVGGNQSGAVLYLVPSYTMSGTVRSGSATGPALAGATVSIAGKTATTSSYGTFSITAIPAGTYTITIAKANFQTKTITGYVMNSNKSGINLYLSPIVSSTISGTVRSVSATGPALAGATVSIASKTATTSSTGTFAISGILPGSYMLTISKSGFTTKTVTGYVVNGNQSGLNFFLLPAVYSMSGTVRSGSATGPVLAGATVSIASKTATTSSTGTFAISGILPGSYTLTISKSGFTTKTVTGYAVTGNQSSLVFYLVPVVTNGTVKVVNGSGSYAITELYISPSSSPYWGPNQTPGAIPPGYSLNVNQVPPDSYDLKAVFSNGASYTKWNFPVVAGMTTTITAVPGGSGVVQMLKPWAESESGAQVPMRQEAGGKLKR